MTPVTVQGHFGEWVQGRLGQAGPVVLITLACPTLTICAPGPDEIPLDRDIISRFAAHLDLDPLPNGIARNFPLGIGAGASTATLVALARSAGFDGAPSELANACIAAEGASDPLMFPEPDRLLWASRRGDILREFSKPPRAEILGGLWGPPERTDPLVQNFEDVSDLITAWAQASEQGDLARLSALATESALRCATRRGTGDPMQSLVRDLGALGMMRAHTGSARGLIFAPGAVPTHGHAALQEAGLSGVLSFETGGT